ncbi:hypothetical protein BJX65DRAFT_291353 [Aspergillus insuetus]
MRISMLHRLIATGCIEEIITYLDHIEEFWTSLVASDRGSMEKIDSDTVVALQLLAPGKSRTDAKTARGRILGGQAFAEFSDEERSVIWSRVENFDKLVPSLHTFFEDFKYLESCGHCVKRLFGPSTESVWKTMSSMFMPSSDEESVVQTSESTFRREQSANAEGLEKGYVQIWLYAMRHYPLMPPDPKKDDDLLAKPTRAKADERAIYEMAELARRLGFESPEIKAIIDSSPDHQIARVALLQARKPNCFRYDAQQFDNLVCRIVDCFAAAVPTQPEIVHDLLADCTVKPRARCGMPRMGAHKQDSPWLFLDRLHADDVEAADNITTFFVRRCVYFAFFGKPARPRPTDYGQTGEPDGDMPQSPLFVGEDGPSGGYESASHAAEPRRSPPEERRRLHAQRGGEQQALRHLQVARGGRERRMLKRRRKWNVPMHSRRRQPTDGGVPDPMELELELQNQEDSDRQLTDQGQPSPELPDAALAIVPRVLPDESPRLERWARTPQPLAHDPIVSEEEDSNSQCTRVSLEAVLHEHDPAETSAMSLLPQESGPQDQTRIDRSPSSEPGDGETLRTDPGGREQGVDAFIDHLMRAQEEQERLEEQLEQERLESELSLSNHEPRTPEQSTEFLGRQSSLPKTPNNDLAEAVLHPGPGSAPTARLGPTQDSLPASRHEGQPAALVGDQEHVVAPPGQGSSADAAGSTTVEAPQPPPGFVEISFWTFERGGWRQSDRLSVDPSDPSLVERVAKKYTWKNYSLYDLQLQSLSPAQCYRAATSDGNNAVFLISEDEEKRLAAEGKGRLKKEKQLLLSASRVLERNESGTKRSQLLRFMKSAP